MGTEHWILFLGADLIALVIVICAVLMRVGKYQEKIEDLVEEVKEVKSDLKDHDDSSVDFREDAIGRISYIEGRINGKPK